MPAEDFASALMARILAFIFLRSRSTLERLSSASDRLPPVRDWMAMTMAKKFASASGMRSGSRVDRLGERQAERLVLDDFAELASAPAPAPPRR